MAKVSIDQWSFLIRHGIDESELFDASGYSRPEYMAAMSRLNLLVAYGVPSCTWGHTLKTRKGHCPQCRPENLSYLRRHNKPGAVYVAHSASLGMVKVGSGEIPSERVRHLRGLAYGGADDWTLEHQAPCGRAGKAETTAHGALWWCKVDGHAYIKTGELIQCRELFRCALGVAKGAVDWAVDEVG